VLFCVPRPSFIRSGIDRCTPFPGELSHVWDPCVHFQEFRCRFVQSSTSLAVQQCHNLYACSNDQWIFCFFLRNSDINHFGSETEAIGFTHTDWILALCLPLIDASLVPFFVLSFYPQSLFLHVLSFPLCFYLPIFPYFSVNLSLIHIYFPLFLQHITYIPVVSYRCAHAHRS
jgi:hypothetical protein